MKLTELDAAFVGAGGDGVTNADGSPVPRREGVGLAFDCPCGCGSRTFVHFSNPLDGGPPYNSAGQPSWDRTGDTIETLTLHPSIQRMDDCKWHGWIKNGEAVS